MIGTIGKRLRIAFISQPEYYRFMYENDLDEVADVREFDLKFGMGEDSFSSLIEYRADYNIFFRGEYVPNNVLTQLSGVKIALSSEPFPRYIHGVREYTLDSVNRYIDFQDIRNKSYDYVFHYDAASIPFMEWDGLNVSGEFPFPVATNVYNKQQKKRLWDLFFIGRSTPYRERYFGYLKHHYNFLHICHGVWGPELVDYLSSTAIGLNVHAENEISWEPRVQMMMSCEICVISEKLTPNNWLMPGVDYVEIGNPEEMCHAVQYYLHNDNERQLIAQNGAKKIRKVLDSRVNFLRLIQEIENGQYSRFGTSNSRIVINAIKNARILWRKSKNFIRCVIDK